MFLRGSATFLESEMNFSKLLVQPPHHLVTCAHHKSSFSFFCTFMQLIMNICLWFPTLSVAIVMLLKIYSICAICHGPAGVPRLATRCLCVLSTWLVVCLVPCAPMSIVCPLPSCYLIIVSVAPAVSPSLPSFVSLYSLLVSAVLG